MDAGLRRDDGNGSGISPLMAQITLIEAVTQALAYEMKADD